ncbi:MAG: CHAT domain-containing protein [Proteobacteria bacterium]|nr:CHAT domain-containing protein [Pseudomonadota bacterium]
MDKNNHHRSPESTALLHLDVGMDGDNIRISAFEQKAGEVMTTRYYENLQGFLPTMEERIRQTVDTLNRANKRGRLTPELLNKLKGVGQLLRDELLTLSVKKTLEESQAEHLVLSLDEKLIHIPWELLHDGKQFLCQRFSMGRIVKTRNRLVKNESRPQAYPMDMLILADPVSDLPSAYMEGIVIRDLLENHPDMIRVSFRSGNIPLALVKEKIRSFDMVHFAGHSDYHGNNPENSGWRFQKGGLTAKDVMTMAGTAHMPSLVFSNACQSGRSKAWSQDADYQEGLFGLADAFIYAGVRHYIGTFWDILDEPGKHFAQTFYQGLMTGASIGSALKQARSELVTRYGEETIVWASYLLYGDPSTCYVEPSMKTQWDIPSQISETHHISLGAQGVRAPEDVIEFSTGGTPRKRTWRPWLLALLIMGVLGTGAYGVIRSNRIQSLEATVLGRYRAGEFALALDQCEALIEKAPMRSLAHLISGNIHFSQGDMDRAGDEFETILNNADADKHTRAQALMGLGRIFSLSQKKDSALSYYRAASDLEPLNWEPFFYQAVLLEQQGRYAEAGELVERASRLDPDQPDLRMFAQGLPHSINPESESKRKLRISQMINDLKVRQTNQGTSEKTTTDSWTSRPLTIWIRDLVIQGFSQREGLDRLVISGLNLYLLQGPPGMIVVERNILEAVLDELNISTSNLADPTSPLNLGHLMAARFILAGRMTCSAGSILISLRLIETESGRIVCVLNETYDRNASADMMSRDLGQKLQNVVAGQFPLRGRIVTVTGNRVTLNIGLNQGVIAGQRFKTMAESPMEALVVDVNTNQSIAQLNVSHPPLDPGTPMELVP